MTSRVGSWTLVSLFTASCQCSRIPETSVQKEQNSLHPEVQVACVRATCQARSLQGPVGAQHHLERGPDTAKLAALTHA